MTVLELIEEGLMAQDWDYIREARKLLKKSKVEPAFVEPEQPIKVAKQKATSKKLVTKKVTVEEEQEVQVRPKKKTTKKSPATKTKKAGRPKKSRLIEPEEDDVDINIAPLEGAVQTEIEPDVDVDDIQEPIASRPQPYQKRKGGNRFTDDGTLFSADTEWDEKAWAGKKPEPRTRPKAKMVKCKCHACQRTVEVSAALAPRKIGDEVSLFRCNRCIGGR